MRSITSGAGRFELVDALPRGASEELALFVDTGVLMSRIGVGLLGVSSRLPPTTLTSEISTSSSSPNEVAFVDWVFSCSADLVVHRPLGSMVTTSKLLGVFCSMSLTYLNMVRIVVAIHFSGRPTHLPPVARMALVCCIWDKPTAALVPAVASTRWHQSIGYACTVSPDRARLVSCMTAGT